MQFTRIPPQYAPLGGALRYGIDAGTKSRIDVRIIDAKSSSLLGAKRFVASAVEFDAAPYLRNLPDFTPAPGTTGFRSAAGRTASVVVEALAVPDPAAGYSAAEPVRTPVRTLLPVPEALEGPTLLTTMPAARLLMEGDGEELNLFSEEPVRVTVAARTGDSLIAESYTSPTGGLQIFRVDTRDYPQAEELSVDAGACGTVTYSVIPRPHGSVRLAWRSSAGSVEHYTFPAETTATTAVRRQQAYGPDGILTTAVSEQRRVLRSAYESREVLEALAELLASPRVLLLDEHGYSPVVVTSDTAVVHRLGTMSCLEVEIRPKHKIPSPWSC